MPVGKLELVYRFTTPSNSAPFTQTNNESAGTPIRSKYSQAVSKDDDSLA